MIKRIKKIKNMAVYKNFSGDQIPPFERVNIFYGRNYSGKTTLSRILRAFETGTISNKYSQPEFELEMKDNTLMNQNLLSEHNRTFRVFNEDFIKENLNYVVNPDESIRAFAILGQDNNQIESQIQDKQSELGSEFDTNSLIGTLYKKDIEWKQAERKYNMAESTLKDKIIYKANGNGTGIKHNKEYGNANYKAPDLRNDIKTVISPEYKKLEDNHIESLKKLIREEQKPEIPIYKNLELKFSEIEVTAKHLVEKKIKISQPLQELLQNSLLQEWVRLGKTYHSDRTTCGFCGHTLDSDLMERLDKHFNKESEELRIQIQTLIKNIDSKEADVRRFYEDISVLHFYSNYQNEILELQEKLKMIISNHIKNINQIKSVLNKRLESIFEEIQYPLIENVTSNLYEIKERLEIIRNESNSFTTKLAQEKVKARIALRLNDVSNFVESIDYYGIQENLRELQTKKTKLETERNIINQTVSSLRSQISALSSQLKDETKGAERVNEYLTNFFGHDHLSLKAIKDETNYRFEIIRDGRKAYHLSEGESSLVAFCYFVAKLEDHETQNLNSIIWIDDPISSLDNNHIFFIFSLINSQIINKGVFKQLFISTHNLDFLKYLKRLAGEDINSVQLQRKYFIIERKQNESSFRIMPKYMKNYVTEFNYLFHQIYKCANSNDTEIEYDCFYNFGNNARKFLESYLYYKYPNANDKDKDKITRFFGNDRLVSSLTERIINEYSHLDGIFERSSSVIDIPEMKKVAQFILNKINEKDPEQYNSLVESIRHSDS